METMTREQIVSKIIDMAHAFVPDLENVELTEDSSINTDANVDSMSMILLVTKIESAFEIDIPEEEWDKIQTVRQLADKVEEGRKNRG